MAEDRDKEREDGQKRPSRPVTAAARRERRASARPAARKDAVEAESAAETTAVKPVPKGKTTGPEKTRRTARTDARAKAADAKGRPTRARDDSKATRQGLFSRIFRFLREVVAELRKVIWPTRKQMVTYTAVVLVFLAVLIALIAGMDFVLLKGALWLFS